MTSTAKHRAEKSGKLGRFFFILSISLMAGFIVATTIFYGVGGRWFIIQTPSMGEYTPVGSLVLSTPTTVEELSVGDTILFKPPAFPDETYFHRIISINSEGIQTAGDMNGTDDQWVLGQQDLVGKELAHFFGLGYLINAIPILLIGGLLLHVITRYYVAAYWRYPTKILGWSAIVSLAIFITQPLVRAVLITQNVEDGVATTIFVPTGLFGLHGQAEQGTSVNLRPGEQGLVTSEYFDKNGYYHVDLSPYLNLTGWIIVISLCLLPLLLCVVYALRKVELIPLPENEADTREENDVDAQKAEATVANGVVLI
jgi:signal peptidase I